VPAQPLELACPVQTDCLVLVTDPGKAYFSVTLRYPMDTAASIEQQRENHPYVLGQRGHRSDDLVHGPADSRVV
jgi:hypothetical protein